MMRNSLRICFATLLLLSMLISQSDQAKATNSSQTKDATTITISKWEKLTLPEGVDAYFLSLGVDPNNARIAYLGGNTGIYKTVDAGTTWMHLDGSPAYPQEIFVVPNRPQRIYVSGSGSIIRSDDGGSTWTYFPIPAGFSSLQVSLSDSDCLYLSPYTPEKASTFLRSKDAGQSWETINTNLHFVPTYTNIYVSPTDSNLLLLITMADGIFRSIDGGNTWTKTTHSPFGNFTGLYDLHPPYTFYLTSNQYLLRSTDWGLTWQITNISASDYFFNASPTLDNILISGDSQRNYLIESSQRSWKSSVWSAPDLMHKVWQSFEDSSVTYAASYTSLWRKMLVGVPNAIFLPYVQNGSESLPANDAAKQALARVNQYRAIAGLLPMRLSPSITKAAQNHAEYFAQNPVTSRNPSDYHSEIEGKPGFTGIHPSNRMQFAGWKGNGGAEVMHFLGDPVSSVDGWMATIYHRVGGPLDPINSYTGYGNHLKGVIVDVMDAGYGLEEGDGVWIPYQSPYPLAYPVNGQTGVPTSWNGAEIPNPLPPGASTPVGYPFTIQGVYGSIEVTSADLREANGQVVPTHPSPSSYSQACYALIAIRPLKTNTTYKAHVVGRIILGVMNDQTVAIPFDQVWTFTTGSK